MTTDEAIAYTKQLGWRVWSLSEQTTGGWRARLWHPEHNRSAGGLRGFNDAFTDYGEGPTAADAILHAARLRIDRQTGKVVEHPTVAALPMDTNRKGREEPQIDLLTSMARLGAALDRLTEALP